MTQDHKPELEPEKRRIEALGGFVSYIGCWRAMGILAMSRAIGDLFLKPYVSADPEVTLLPLEPTDEFFVLASDGVYDVFDNDQVVRIVRSAATPQEAATLLTSSAFHAGSLDNVTAIVVALKGYKPRGSEAAASPAEEPAGRRDLLRWWPNHAEADEARSSEHQCASVACGRSGDGGGEGGGDGSSSGGSSSSDGACGDGVIRLGDTPAAAAAAAGTARGAAADWEAVAAAAAAGADGAAGAAAAAAAAPSRGAAHPAGVGYASVAPLEPWRRHSRWLELLAQ